MSAVFKTLLVIACVAITQHGYCQNFYYEGLAEFKTTAVRICFSA